MASGKIMSRGFAAPCYRYFGFMQQHKSQTSRCPSETTYLAGNSFFPRRISAGCYPAAPKSAPQQPRGSLLPKSLGLPLPLLGPAKPFPADATPLLVSCFCPHGVGRPHSSPQSNSHLQGGIYGPPLCSPTVKLTW